MRISNSSSMWTTGPVDFSPVPRSGVGLGSGAGPKPPEWSRDPPRGGPPDGVELSLDDAEPVVEVPELSIEAGPLPLGGSGPQLGLEGLLGDDGEATEHVGRIRAQCGPRGRPVDLDECGGVSRGGVMADHELAPDGAKGAVVPAQHRGEVLHGLPGVGGEAARREARVRRGGDEAGTAALVVHERGPAQC